jgi:hypothetical protein
MSRAQKVPTSIVSITRNAIMYSLTRMVMLSQLARMQIGISKLDSSTNGIEMPSTPMW